ncbi:MAG: 2Fe-2S iron-sulfur cluster binding domain-containing protein [Hyphomicrobium sp.]|nr:2Fe-2S iron-sulfur cluster binding domain-containing protein [Hyphomicrobium sp.]
MSNADRPGRLGPELWDATPGKWNADEDDTLICAHVRQETHDVKSFLFRTESPRLFRFRPGQFITLELAIDGEVINRCYTISSPPTRPDTLSITVKRHPGGKVSNWLHDNMRPGAKIKALGPSGEFSCTLHPGPKYLFLSGGSGVTPLMSMARTLYELGDDHDVVFVHSARSPRDIIFRHELAMMAHGTSNFRTAFVCEKIAETRDWSAPTGYLSLPLLKSIVPDLAAREIFCCGPEAYMANVRAMLREAPFDMAHYHEESFSFERQGVPLPEAEAAAPGAAAPVDTFKIEFTRSGRTIECRPDQFILDAARAAGMRLPFSCSKGVCGTCKSKKLSGQVEMKHGGGIRQREIDAGMILICCSKPLENVTIEK